MSIAQRKADASQRRVRQSAGWIAFLIARHAVRLSARLLGREAPLGHVLRDLASALERLDRGASRRARGGGTV